MLSSVYHRHLGGNDFNNRIFDYLLQTYNTKSGQEPVNSDIFLHRMKIEVEKAKKLLSTQDSVQINVKHPDSGGQDLSEQLTRSQFEDLNMDLFTKTLMSIDQAIKDSVVFTKDDIQDVVFSGGSANIPFLQSAIQQYFGADKNYHGLVQPESTVVLGAAKSHHWYRDDSYSSCCTGEYGSMFGIGISGGAMFQFSDPASHLNTNKMFTFTTTMDNQDRIVIGVFRGSGEQTKQNSFWGGVELVFHKFV
ncbi:ATPase with role in protein import into the ER [Dissophora globulifera]|uniref:ATPase with role in protein import into the ER n=1 Tax=Dissophora globulifera TaxID=979702 RepID=A0A9P6R2E2_9FUNG|nr:ATPase with role in protein import into the ER [Dissophora globulifera]